MELFHEIVTVRTKHTFTISRGGASEWKTVAVRVRDADGAEGLGEAAPNRFYGENPESVVAALARFRPVLADLDPWHLEEAEARMNATIRFNAAAKSGVSAALHDLAAKRLGVPLYRMWGLDPARAPQSSFTIAIAPDDATLRARVEEASAYPVLKIKLGSAEGIARDQQIIRLVREAAPHALLRVDANAAWTPKHALLMIELLADLGVQFVEQPLPAHDIPGMRFVRERSPLPIVADESCVVSTDIPPLVGAVDGINIKLAKCGGLREALRMIATARSHGLLVMCGCMIETSLGITAAAHLSPLLDYADLDGAALLADDPYVGATIDGGQIAIPDRPGLGVARR
ncbi:Mandelate racemase/muconate lactonizing protein [Gemmatirosa kalamazoonensis]|uniref:Dipeptide epimerase n=1 Tax=Gemmatirosa kalamazoonensis TaxID=861299 RepID=W0RHW0_9BACT|nr:dipeptide epimerase [Gemmatirosa kalamazoonensis]AHG90361.1 Mandelate racemase/muconate lactonizing protein [Gemmatirosa kalamazoonensis]